MNLLEDEWLTVIRRNDEQEKLKGLWQITAGIDSDNPIVDVISPRADFKGALYQLLIGLIQSTIAPKDNRYKWKNYWDKPPNTDILKNAFLTVKDAFEIDTHKPAFMQDFDLLADKTPVPIASLLIDTSGGGTFFIKEGGTSYISPYWAAIALYTLQTNAPAGGVGHRTGLRGGGPLTTLILPNETEQTASLWHKLWLNVLAKQESDLQEPHTIFPWLARTRTSEAGSKTVKTEPEHGHPYQMYWGMPRRIRLDFDNTKAGYCDISHEYSEHTLSHYRTQNYGVNYSSTWIHPLTPYVKAPQKEPYSIKPQVGGFNYRHWLGITLDDDKNHKQSAKIVQVYLERRRIIEGDFQPRLWLFGYDMDNMKARCWYETTMPIFPVSQDQKKILQDRVGKMINAASEVALDIRSTLKQAWFEKPKEVKGDISFTDSQFWQITENDFYRLVEQLISCCENDEQVNKLFAQWKQLLHRHALTLFDHWALSSNNEDGDMKRVVTARHQLEIWLHTGKNIKALVA
jgi:CRISPR system Cascade subunit CasA